jgi:anti-anti-sigma factor
MGFTITSEMTDGAAVLTLAGELDASAAPAFRAEIEKAAAHAPKKLVLIVKDLEYVASAGLRVLIFAKQKMGMGVDVVLVGAQEMVRDTLQKTGFHHSVILVDEYEANAA